VEFSGAPTAAVRLPPAVAALAAGRDARCVWSNEVGGLTFRVEDGGAGLFVKWAPAGIGLDLPGEAERLHWAGRFTPVPAVLDLGRDGAGSWLVTAGLRGDNAVSAPWVRRPAETVAAIGAGLRALHDALPVADCPFDWSAGTRLADARVRAAAGRLDPARFADEHRGTGVPEALARLADVPDVDRLVVCHGDACAPNTLLDERGWTGHVDLGALGVADRWADLAVATWSTTWNYGPGWERPLLEAYGVAPDAERTAYYRLLWDVGP
jgi:kanamycin kinase